MAGPRSQHTVLSACILLGRDPAFPRPPPQRRQARTVVETALAAGFDTVSIDSHLRNCGADRQRTGGASWRPPSSWSRSTCRAIKLPIHPRTRFGVSEAWPTLRLPEDDQATLFEITHHFLATRAACVRVSTCAQPGTSHGTIASTGTTRRTRPGPSGALARGPGRVFRSSGGSPPHSSRRSARGRVFRSSGRSPPHSLDGPLTDASSARRGEAPPHSSSTVCSADTSSARRGEAPPHSSSTVCSAARLPLGGAKPSSFFFDGLLRGHVTTGPPLVERARNPRWRNDWRGERPIEQRAPGSEGPSGGGAASRPAHHGRDQPDGFSALRWSTCWPRMTPSSPASWRNGDSLCAPSRRAAVVGADALRLAVASLAPRSTFAPKLRHPCQVTSDHRARGALGAHSIATAVRTDGAQIAAQRLTAANRTNSFLNGFSS